MRRKFLSLALALVMCLGLTVTAMAEGYSDDQLCTMARLYYGKDNPWQELQYVNVDSENNGIVTLHLFNYMGNHTATCDWYYIDRNTGRGTNLMGERIDLTPYASQAVSGNASNSVKSGTCGANLTWKLENGTMTVSGIGPMTSYEYAADWKGVGPAPWIDFYDSITAIVIEEGVTSVGSYAFIDYSSGTWHGLTSVTLPKSLTTIESMAFAFNYGLKNVYYGGTETEWLRLKSASGGGNYSDNDRLWDAPNIQFNSADSINSAGGGFADIPADAYYAAPVAWAVEKGITAGTTATTFSPGQNCTNAQILTFLWRAYGQPEPAVSNPFTNSIPEAYAKAAVWAYEKGMVSGNTFDTKGLCSRALAVTYMWKAAGSPAGEAISTLADVPSNAEYAQAVAWAITKEVTTGTSASTFSPNDICTRGQIVTFLHRDLA